MRQSIRVAAPAGRGGGKAVSEARAGRGDARPAVTPTRRRLRVGPPGHPDTGRSAPVRVGACGGGGRDKSWVTSTRSRSGRADSGGEVPGAATGGKALGVRLGGPLSHWQALSGFPQSLSRPCRPGLTRDSVAVAGNNLNSFKLNNLMIPGPSTY